MHMSIRKIIHRPIQIYLSLQQILYFEKNRQIEREMIEPNAIFHSLATWHMVNTSE